MIPKGETQIVDNTGTVTWAVNGVGFKLEPLNYLARFPAEVYLDGTPGLRYLVENAGENLQEATVQSVSIVDGTPGAKWRLTPVPHATDRTRGGSTFDRQGLTLVRPSGGDVLARVDFNAASSLPADGAPDEGLLWLTQDEPGRFRADSSMRPPGDTSTEYLEAVTWDVRAYKRLRFYFESNGLIVQPDGSAYTQLMFRITGHTYPSRYDRALMTSVGFVGGNGVCRNFASTPQDPVFGLMELGALVDVDNGGPILRNTERVNFIRVQLLKQPGEAMAGPLKSRAAGGGVWNADASFVIEAL